mgnify:CR=1 FL=1
MDDDRLIAAVAAGDDVALRELFTQHAPWLAARLRRLLPADAVEDVLQETFIAVWRGARAYKAEGAPGAWIWGIARRQAALWARTHERPEAIVEATVSDDPAVAATTRADVQHALDALGPAGDEQRELVRLMFIEDRAVADVAARLGVPEGTVKSRVFKVRRLLQAALQHGGS